CPFSQRMGKHWLIALGRAGGDRSIECSWVLLVGLAPWRRIGLRPDQACPQVRDAVECWGLLQVLVRTWSWHESCKKARFGPFVLFRAAGNHWLRLHARTAEFSLQTKSSDANPMALWPLFAVLLLVHVMWW